jgi:hypothetical protein
MFKNKIPRPAHTAYFVWVRTNRDYFPLGLELIENFFINRMDFIFCAVCGQFWHRIRVNVFVENGL